MRTAFTETKAPLLLDVAAWRNPFESNLSIRRKHEWINDGRVARIGDWNVRDMAKWNTWSRSFNPNAGTQNSGWLHAMLNLPCAVCPVCLKSGYWSELPQLAGLDKCPLHGVPLQFRCEKCRELLMLGSPRFHESAFQCEKCRCSVVPRPSSVSKQWAQARASDLGAKFASLLMPAHQLAKEFDCEWSIPWKVAGCHGDRWKTYNGDLDAITRLLAPRSPFPEITDRNFKPRYSRNEKIVAHTFFVPDVVGPADFKTIQPDGPYFKDVEDWCRKHPYPVFWGEIACGAVAVAVVITCSENWLHRSSLDTQPGSASVSRFGWIGLPMKFWRVYMKILG